MADTNGEHPEVQIPASVEAAWGLRERPARGPRPGLTLDRVVAAAITVADAEGLAAVSMGRVATELGSSPMSLYRYVASKDELLALMVDAAMGPVPRAATPTAEGVAVGWRSGLEHWSWGALEAYLRAPWIARVPIPAPPITPNQIRWMEAGLTCLRGTGLSEQEKLSTILLLSGIARNQAAMAADFADAARAAGGRDPSAGYGQALRRLAPPEEFPAVHAAVLSGSLEDDDDDFTRTEMAFALDRILDGLEVLVRRRLSAAAADGASTAPTGAAPR